MVKIKSVLRAKKRNSKSNHPSGRRNSITNPTSCTVILLAPGVWTALLPPPQSNVFDFFTVIFAGISFPS